MKRIAILKENGGCLAIRVPEAMADNFIETMMRKDRERGRRRVYVKTDW